ncbi:U3 small nucleolar RNA-interacting protein [Musa troglodytarum]|uniref:U3 small nucleolar RNA-interacting protein n=1 Tax=Musa troglodytarum TaxID=320322 RepID=A0A9E7L858_9LILI|nr:U3 small nucleolar RNA-interacting protein [Musa troglodytarum]
MKPRSRKRDDRPKAGKKKPRSFGGDNGFFESDAKRRGRRRGGDDDDVESIDSDEDLTGLGAGEEEVGEGAPEETADEKRVRVAKEHLERIRAIAKRVEEEEGEEEDEEEGREEREGKRDSLVAEILQKEQLLESGRIRRLVASRVSSPQPVDEFRWLVKHRQSVTSVTLAEDDSRGFSASKDGVIMHWDIESGKSEKYLWPSEDVLVSHYAKPLQNSARKRSKNVLALAVSSDGRYLASGGMDRHVHLWDTRTREHLQVPEESQLVFRAPASSLECCCFINDSEFLSGSDDGSIELWSVMRKKPAHLIKNAHAPSLFSNGFSYKEEDITMSNGGSAENGSHGDENCSSAHAWVSSVAVCRGSDLAASGAANGVVRVWAIDSDSKGISPLLSYPLAGFINSLAFAKSARFLVAGVGQLEDLLNLSNHACMTPYATFVEQLELQLPVSINCHRKGSSRKKF